MDWKASPPAIELASQWTAAVCLGAAVGFAFARIAPGGAGLVIAGLAAVVSAVAALAVFRTIDRRLDGAFKNFAQIDAVSADEPGDDVLLLDCPVGDDDSSRLNERDCAPDETSRVVRLFAGEPVGPRATGGAPGEMLARIEQFLDDTRGPSAVAIAERPTGNLPGGDASAALHAALADIRRSLRQG